MIRTDFEYSPDEKAVVAYGFLQRIEGGGEIESGPLFTHNVPSPFAGDHGMKGGPMPLPSSDGSEPQSSDDLDLESFADGSPESSAEASAEASEEASAESNIDPSPEAILDLLRGIELEAYY